ncbi:MAG TPA: polysaccharide lyase family protein [Opitutaceae bacterium]|nr:polysaccharide lyase family protein [Opitutaceae bacterium]
MDARALLTTLAAAGLLLAAAPARAADAPVTVREDGATYLLDNGIVAARVARASGDLVSLRYRGKEMLAVPLTADGQPDLQADPPGGNVRGFAPFTDHQYGFWSHDAMGPVGTRAAEDRVTIDPQANGGERAEVSVKGVSGGRRMGTGPGSSPSGNFAADIDIRYALGRGESGIYTYCIFDHRPEYPASTMTEARFCVKLAPLFDWMLVDAHHHMYYPAEREQKGDDKYNYTADQFDHPAFGWAGAADQIGCFLVNPSAEYLSGGPTKVEFLCHRDTNRIAAPCILNYWRSSHYGGSSVDVAQGESWTKVVGPFLIYLNSGAEPEALWRDAMARAAKEKARWPYGWVSGADYPHRAERAAVSGQLVLRDSGPAGREGAHPFSHLLVGLTHPDYRVTTERAAGSDTPVEITWMTDAKHYEFWVHAGDDGSFVIPEVRPGRYTLHAISDGILGEFARADVTVAAGQPLRLGALTWTPRRLGRQVWEIGIPNRNGSEFRDGDNYFHDRMAVAYARQFPRDIDYQADHGDFAKDWYFEQVPHPDLADPAIAAAEAPRVMPPPPKPGEPRRRFVFPPPILGRATPWRIHFTMPDAPKGRATLRVAIAGGSTSGIPVEVNGQLVGVIKIDGDSTVGRNGIQGLWYEREVPFAASWLKAGENTLTLTVPAGSINQGIIYDYLRLELDEHPAGRGLGGG